MKETSHWYSEEIIERKIILELPTAKTTYKKYCENMWEKKLQELSSDDLLLHLVRSLDWAKNETGILDGKPFIDLQLLDALYGIKFNEKSTKDKTFSISVENYLLSRIMDKFAILWIPQYRKYELSQQLRYNIDEVFYNKTIKGYFWVYFLANNESEILFDYVYTYVKYHNNTKYFRDDEGTRRWYNFIAKEEIVKDVFSWVRNVHYKENKKKNHLLFYLLYLTIYEWLELSILYDHSDRINCFKVCDKKSREKYIDKWCAIVWLYNILINVFKVLGSKDNPQFPKWKVWDKVLDDIIEASEKATTFTYTVSWRGWLPMLWQITFIHTDTSKYRELKKYAGEFWWVIPMKWIGNKKILDWKKKLNYKKYGKGNEDK